MLLCAVSVLVVAQSSSEIPEGLMNNPVLYAYMEDTLTKDVTGSSIFDDVMHVERRV